MSVEKIGVFAGPFRFLSNFHPVEVTYEGDVYPSVEHAYQAAKTSRDNRKWFQGKTIAPRDAKGMGRRVKMTPEFEARKDAVMEELVRKKFQDPELRELLLNTGTAVLEEGNYWGDYYWGVCNDGGLNKLGKILMKVREEIRDGQGIRSDSSEREVPKEG